jgi:lysophospholipase L1-like esterase
MSKKRILIYGDSNTHGADEERATRFDENTRWTKVCQQILGDEYKIIEEGLSGRTTCHDDNGELPLPEAPYINGLTHIGPIVCSHLPLDVICVKLGSNDVGMPGETPESIAENAARVLRAARDLAQAKYPDHPVKCALMAPLEVTEDALTGAFSFVFNDPAIIEQSQALPPAYEKKATEEGWLYFNANEHARCGKWDGIHLDAENHGKMAAAVAKWIKETV